MVKSTKRSQHVVGRFEEIDSAATREREPYVIVSCDSHVHPSLAEDYHDYCPLSLESQFRDFVKRHSPETLSVADVFLVPGVTEGLSEEVKDLFFKRAHAPGYRDASIRIRDMDEQGIAAEVMFHGGGAFGPMPFETSSDLSLRTAGVRMFNRWLADFVSTSPDRLIGVAQLPYWDLHAAVQEVKWAAGAGLRSVSFPAPRAELPAEYNDRVWDPFWSQCVEGGVVLNCHAGSGQYPLSRNDGGYAIFASESGFYGRRALPFLVFGGVFDRFPSLKLAFTEQRGAWAASMVRNMEAVYISPLTGAKRFVGESPREYWKRNCYVGNSFMARFEAEMRHDIGIDQLMWGSDYPHLEGTWPWTKEALRRTFSGLPYTDVRKILGDNAIRCFSLDDKVLRGIAEKIGPTPASVDVPLDVVPPEAEAVPTLAFREVGEFA